MKSLGQCFAVPEQGEITFLGPPPYFDIFSFIAYAFLVFKFS